MGAETVSIQGEAAVTPSFTSIGDMPPGHFWMRAHTIGMTQGEIDLLVAGARLSDQRAAQIHSATEKAIQELSDAKPAGPEWHMSWRRAMC